MLKMTAGQKKMIAWFAVAVAIAVLHTSTSLPDLLHLHDIHTLVYAGIVIAWGFLVHQRINNRLARQHLVAASVFMFILFLSRLVRWICFGDSPVVMEYAWYAYYVSFTGVTLCCFLAALCVGKSEKDRPLHVAKWLWLLQIGLSVLVLTNSFHELFSTSVMRPMKNMITAFCYTCASPLAPYSQSRPWPRSSVAARLQRFENTPLSLPWACFSSRA